MKTVDRGFTLIEVLVVLVITALVSTLLFQALAQVYRLHERFGEQLAQSRAGAMRVDWYRQVLQGLQTDYADGKQRFVGDARHLAGLSATPLTESGGAPQWLTLEVAADTSVGGELRYSYGSRSTALLQWSSPGRAEFAYLDDAGAEHAVWPPQASGVWPQLPAAVLFRWPKREGADVLVATPAGSREAKIRAMPLSGVTP